MMYQLLHEKNLPALLSRTEMLHILQEEEYGFVPKAPSSLDFCVQQNIINNFCAGKAHCHKIIARCTIEGQVFSFPFYGVIPAAEGKHPFFVHINFRDNVPDQYMPTEELVDHGFAVFSFCYTDVTSDDGDFTNGLAGAIYGEKPRAKNDPGKIALWAWAAQRVMDYAQTLQNVLDLDTAVVCGHSRLGKTALLAAATDERFTFAYSNDSGCSGAAITRGKRGETVKHIYNRFPYWFCENYSKFIDCEETMPFDQHFLAASIAPRKVLIGSASEDIWADPIAEQLCCYAASPAFQKGFTAPSRAADIGDAFLEGDIGYHLRKGLHYFSREDWLRLIQFVAIHSRNSFIK